MNRTSPQAAHASMYPSFHEGTASHPSRVRPSSPASCRKCTSSALAVEVLAVDEHARERGACEAGPEELRELGLEDGVHEDVALV